jgi:biotin transporter BioY
MYIIAIAWLYVVTLMAATEKTITAGLLTFIFYGLLPCALFLWVLGVKHRRHIQHKKSLLEDDVSNPDSTHTNRDE